MSAPPDYSRPHGDDYTWGLSVILRPTLVVGRVGHRRSGHKLHLLRAAEVVGIVPGHTPKSGSFGAEWLREQERAAVGRIPARIWFWAGAPCNGNGQHVGQPIPSLPFSAVTCERCLAAGGFNTPEAPEAPEAAK